MAAAHIAREAVHLEIVSGRSPISVAAAAIYMASQVSDDKRTQKEISEIAGVADVTIRQSYKLMHPRAADLFPSNFNFNVRFGYFSFNCLKNARPENDFLTSSTNFQF